MSIALAVPVDGCHRVTAERVAEQWGRLLPHEQAELSRFAPPQAVTTPIDPVTCIAARAAERLESDHFVVEWDDTGVISAAQAADVSAALELSFERLFVDLGWRLPEGVGVYKLPVWLTNDPSDGGFATEVMCDGLSLPVITIDAGTFNWGTWYQDVAAHELHHASHYRYGRAFDNWWWEATAIWIQEQVYPANNEWAYYVDFYVANPMWALEDTSYGGDEGRHMYGSSLWVFWLEQEHGGHDFVQGLWERSTMLPANQSATMADVLAPEVSIDETFVRYANAIPTHEIGEGSLYADVAHTLVTEVPADGSPGFAVRPEPWGMHYVRFTGAALSPMGLAVDVGFEANATLKASLLGVRAGQVAEVVEADANGAMVLTEADTFDEAWLSVVALGGVGAQDYEWTAHAVGHAQPTATADTGTEDTGESSTDEPALDVDEKGCGCSATRVGWGGWALSRRR